MKLDDYKFEDNKIIFTNNLFKTIKKLTKHKNTLLITPLNKLDDFIDIKPTNIFGIFLKEKFPDLFYKLINEEEVFKYEKAINDYANLNIIESNIAPEKIFKLAFNLKKNLFMDQEYIKFIINLYETFSSTLTNIVLIGFDKFASKLITQNYSNVNLITITNQIKQNLTWNNLEALIIDKKEEFIEIIDKDKLVSFLEYNSKTVLTLNDLNDFFNDHESFNSYLIQRSFNKI